MSDAQISDKSYGTAIILCGLFGVLGVHHFYLENFIHGAIDFGLFVLAVGLLVAGLPLVALAVFLADALHSIIVFYLLITEQARDGQGHRVTLSGPSQL